MGVKADRTFSSDSSLGAESVTIRQQAQTLRVLNQLPPAWRAPGLRCTYVRRQRAEERVVDVPVSAASAHYSIPEPTGFVQDFADQRHRRHQLLIRVLGWSRKM